MMTIYSCTQTGQNSNCNTYLLNIWLNFDYFFVTPFYSKPKIQLFVINTQIQISINNTIFFRIAMKYQHKQTQKQRGEKITDRN